MKELQEIINRYHGCLLGLAVGDALGTTLEFKLPGSFTPITNMIGGGPFNLKSGEWTDDTSMALCLAESLIECQNFNPRDQMERYVRWWRKGHLSSTGTCFDIGSTTRAALAKFMRTSNPISDRTDSFSAGNGSLMRLAPVPMFYAAAPLEAIEKSGESSKTTHGAPAAIDACRYFGALIVGALNGEDKEVILSDHYCPLPNYWKENPLIDDIAAVASGSFKRKNIPEIQGSGYVVKSLEAALWAFYRSESFEEGCLLAVNLGDDADTTGAIYGQIAGAYYKVNNIPIGWRNNIYDNDLIMLMAEKLMDGAMIH